MLKFVALTISFLGMIVAYFELHTDELQLAQLEDVASQYDVRILRDSWGVPHVFGVTDPDAAFGLAYAHAEDDFITIQRSMLAVRGRMAAVFGPKHVPSDYFVHLLRVVDVVNDQYDTELSAETRAVCEGYAAGLNHYAALHRDEILPGLFPVTGKDVVAGFVARIPLFLGLHETVKELFEPRPRQSVTRAPVAKNSDLLPDWKATYGSNTFSVAPSRSADGKTLLAVNSHQPWEGPFTWYEVHVRSEQGWDMVGSVFPGSPVVIHGHNRDLGWAHTVNKPDLVDVYVLQMNPENANQYRYDGEWRTLDAQPVSIEVKLFGPISWTLKKEVLWSVHGPVIRRPHGSYAIRYAGMGEIRHVEQWYRMNKAHNFDEWQNAMRLQALPKFNCGYADADGNIYFLYNALLPIRAEGYDWKHYLPGNTSKTLWTNYLPLERLPQIKNPASGFIQNCNSSPFQTTVGPENPQPEAYSPTFGIETHMTNRALRALELFGSDESISEEEFYEYKYDMSYSSKSEVATYVQRIITATVPELPIAREALKVLKAWDLRTDPDNRSAALAVLTIKDFVQNGHDKEDLSGLLETFLETARDLKQHFGRIDVPWKRIHRLLRGELDLGLGGGPDVLHAVYADRMEDGRLKGAIGDSYVLLVAWDAKGQVRSRSVHQYGSATIDKNSPHYADQAPLFVQRKLKPVWLDEAEIQQHLEREYRPGEETTQ